MIDLIPVKHTDKERLGFIERVYTEAFPVDERREFREVKNLLVSAPAFHLTGIESEGNMAGMISYWEWDGLAYVEHFAIDERYRGGGFGGETLKRLLSLLPVPVVLEVERPDDDISRRRIGFYERLGFRLWPQPYVQPPYDKNRRSLDLLLMTYGDIDLSQDFTRIRDIIYREVYGVG